MTPLQDIIARNLGGEAVALPSWCTAHAATLRAILGCYRDDAAPVLIEATCNQVNQGGGYTGLTPAAFRAFAEGLAQEAGVAPARLILGGDHLGPNPWRHLPADAAMDKARAMVAAYAEAGFTKIHLDASMRCADDATLPEATMAARAADLCAVAEAAAPGRLSYVIGTEVPVPGGETEPLDALAVTRPEAAERTLSLHREAFAARGLTDAAKRVVGIVVQPGVDFGNDRVYAFDPAQATALAAVTHLLGGAAFEAHSTDYQTPQALVALVRSHFAILKVGPELTFAFRQAAFAAERLEELAGLPPSGLTPALLAAMRARPSDWRAHVAAGPEEQAMMLYGLSDRVRYYWTDPGVQAALATLWQGLRAAPPAPGLVAQVTGGLVGETGPGGIVASMVGAVVQKYRTATGG